MQYDKVIYLHRLIFKSLHTEINYLKTNKQI